MNSFSKWPFQMLLLFACLELNLPAHAIVLTGIYTGACNRKIGLILGVDTYRLKFLGLDGREEVIPRYQVIQLASYSLDELPPFSKGQDQIEIQSVPAFQIYTLNGVEEKVLLTGYPIDFTEEKIAFLTSNGNEVLIDKTNIARIARLENLGLKPSSLHRSAPVFGQVYAFMKCPADLKQNTAATLVQPEQVLSEPLTIKRELDRLQHGFDLVERYLDEQVFYSEPMIYKNKTRLGLWETLGSRYGSSSSRSNNGTPILNNEYASDIYDYQRIISTGAQPNPLFEHEEAQTQALFAFKASYFHFVGYADPNQILVGKNYQYRIQDVSDGDVKIASVDGGGLGFDRDGWQIGFMATSVDIAANIGGNLYADYVPVHKLYLSYKNYLYGFELITGSGTKSDFGGDTGFDGPGTTVNFQNTRFNYYQLISPQWNNVLSIISNVYSVQDSTLPKSLNAQATSVSDVFDYAFSKRINIDSQISVERYTGSGAISAKNYLKAGTSIHLFF